MTRTGRPRSRRGCVLAAAVMILLLLGASLLTSAGSAHHARPGPATPAATGQDAATDQDAAGLRLADQHEHRHGNDWTPTPGKRLRPAGTVTALGDVPARPGTGDPARGTPVSPATALPGSRLTALSVLRV